jgi:type I restriction enzyme S subunit
MDAQQFLAEFGHIANATGGIQQLREMIYQLAITGTLTPQIAQDGDVRTLLADISALRERLIGEKKYKRLPKLENEALEVPKGIELPPTWCWTRLLDIGEISPRNDAQDETQASFISMSGIPQLHMGKLAPESTKWGAIKKGFTHFANGDVVVAKITPCFENGKAAVIQGLAHTIGAGTTELHVFRPIHSGILPDYIYLFVRSPYFAVEGERNMTGTAGQKRLPTEYFATRAVPLPPTKEQSRIVAKVDELMALCDKLESRQQQRRKLQNALRQSILQAIAAATTPHELQTAWTRLETNFARLFSTPEDVSSLRKLILDLAVHGLLVHQSELDEPIEKWLSDIAIQKAALVKQKLVAKQIALRDVPEEEYPFPLPKGWAFARLGHITNKIGSGSTPRGGREVYVKEGIPFLRSQNVWNDGLRLDDVACITAKEHERMSGTAVVANDVLLNITGASLGRCALVPSHFGEANVSQHVTIIRLTDPQVREYLHLCILSPYTQSMIWGRQVGMAREGLSKKVLEQFEIPLPPLAEQRRIVARVAQLMRLCDVLEDQLRNASNVAERMVVATIASITGITTEQEEDQPMKAPQTELISQLRLGTFPNIKAQAPLATILARHNGEMSARDLWQRWGADKGIDAFYTQLKTEVAHGWVQEPDVAEMRQKASDRAEA